MQYPKQRHLIQVYLTLKQCSHHLVQVQRESVLHNLPLMVQIQLQNGEVINMIVHFSAFFKNASPSFVLVITLITNRKCANLCV